jgi:hypothetical protein
MSVRELAALPSGRGGSDDSSSGRDMPTNPQAVCVFGEFPVRGSRLDDRVRLSGFLYALQRPGPRDFAG